MGDDVVFANVLDEMSLAEFLNKRYFTWSSRVIIETFLVFIASWSPWIWKILNGIVILIQMLYYLVVLLCVIVSIYWIHGRSFETLLQLTIIAAGFMSRFMIGFSPTIYASGDRTALFTSVALLIIVMRNIQVMKYPK